MLHTKGFLHAAIEHNISAVACNEVYLEKKNLSINVVT